MIRYLNIFIIFLTNSFSQTMMYRFSFVNSIFSTLLWGAFQFFFMFLITSKTGTVLGWNRNELYLLTASFNILIGVFRALFSRNLDNLSYIVHYGKLDTYLLKPVDTQFWMSLHETNIASFFRLPFSILISFYFLYLINVNVFTYRYIIFLILLGFGLVILYSIWFLTMTLVIWFTNLTNLKSFLDGLTGATRYPKEIFENTALFLFVLFFPLSLVGSVPTKYLLKKASMTEIYQLIVSAFILFIAARLFWKFALRHYTSASS